MSWKRFDLRTYLIIPEDLYEFSMHNQYVNLLNDVFLFSFFFNV